MNKKTQQQFIQRSALLLESGLSLPEVLSIAVNLERNPVYHRVFQKIKDSVEKGWPLSRAIMETKTRFDLSTLSLISFGESSGILPQTMRQALKVLEKKGDMKRRLVGALIYPLFIALATMAMTSFLVMYIFPTVIPMFSTLNTELPLLTRIVRTFYELILRYGTWCMGIVFVLLFTIWYIYRKNLQFRYRVHFFVLSLPGIGEVLKKYVVSGVFLSIGTLLDCGQPLPKVIERVSASVSILPYSQALTHCHTEILKGALLTVSLKKTEKLFPRIVTDMLHIGEKTGSLGAMFFNISKMYEEELDDVIKKLGTIIEPMLMIVMGIIVGSIALSIILPIYEITNHLKN